ncbi:hypothetical protein Tco_0460584, partial [Tanacetum coccineum]
LTEQMCQPMIEYARSFKAEITSGTCPRLLATLEAMKGVTRDGRVELEQARKMIRAAEEKKREALGMLKESEERMKKMIQYMEYTGHQCKNKVSPSHVTCISATFVLCFNQFFAYQS